MGAFPQTYKPLTTAVQTGVEAATAFMKAREQARAVDEKLDMEAQFNNLKLDISNREIALKQQGVNPDQYPAMYQQQVTEALDTAERSLKFPASQAKFRGLA